MAIFGLIVVGCLIGAYFSRGWNRGLLILLAIAIVELKSLAVGVKIFSVTVIVIVILYFLRSKRNKKHPG